MRRQENSEAGSIVKVSRGQDRTRRERKLDGRGGNRRHCLDPSGSLGRAPAVPNVDSRLRSV